MEIAKLKVDGVYANVVMRSPITAGLAGATIRVEYAAGIWDELTKTVVFRGSVTKDVVTNDTTIEIPWEVLTKQNERLQVGFYGVDDDEKQIIPTIWADLGRIQPGADPSGDTTTDPSLPVWAQLNDKIEDLREQVENITPGGDPEPGGDIDLTGYATEEWVKKGFQQKGDYLPAAELPSAVNAALEQAKKSGEFDGPPGYTPQKNVDYFDGKTPVKGQDYYTEADKAEIVNEVLEQLPASGGGSVTITESFNNGDTANVEDITAVVLHGKNLPGKNLCSLNEATVTHYQEFKIEKIPAGTYTVSAVVTSTDTEKDTCSFVFGNSKTNTAACEGAFTRGKRSSMTRKFTQSADILRLYASNGWAASQGYTATWENIQVEASSDVTEYEPFENDHGIPAAMSLGDIALSADVEIKQNENIDFVSGEVVRADGTKETVAVQGEVAGLSGEYLITAENTVDITHKTSPYVRFTKQTLSEEQKAQARENIGINIYDPKAIGKKIVSGEFLRIILLGDSITDGYGGTGYNGAATHDKTTNTNGYCWANVFKKYIGERYGVPVENYGYYGSIAEEQYNYIKDVVTKGDLVIWLSGTNNRTYESRFSSYGENIAQYVNDIKNKGALVLFMPCIPAANEDEITRYKTTHDINEVAFKNVYGLTYYVDLYTEYIKHCEVNNVSISDTLRDYLHPNDLGYLYIFLLLCHALGIPLNPHTDFSEAGNFLQTRYIPFIDQVEKCTNPVYGGCYAIDQAIPAGTIKKVKLNAQYAGDFNVYFATKTGDGDYSIAKVVTVSVSAGVNELDTEITIEQPMYFIATGENSRYGWIKPDQPIQKLSTTSTVPFEVGATLTVVENNSGLGIGIYFEMVDVNI